MIAVSTKRRKPTTFVMGLTPYHKSGVYEYYAARYNFQ